MANKSKNKGTAAETATVRYLRSRGAADADRLPLKGSGDVGDVRWAHGVHLELKAGNAAHNASVNQIMRWVEEARRESLNARCPVYLLVKRKGSADPAKWRFFCELSAVTNNPTDIVIIEMLFESACLIADLGHLKGFTRNASAADVSIRSL